MLMPKRVKFRRVQRGRMKGKAARGNTLAYGKIGVKVWLYKGEVLRGEAPKTEERPDRKRRPRNGDEKPRRRDNARPRTERKEGGNK